MFELFGSMSPNNYDSRMVDRYEDDVLFVSTALVTDAEKPYETAVAHPNYNNGKIVIVETYDSQQKAQEGHDRWVKIMTEGTLPDKLVDVSVALVALMLDLVAGDNEWREREDETMDIWPDVWNLEMPDDK